MVLGSRFGDIFRSNSGKSGLLVGVVEQKIIEELWDYVEAHPANADHRGPGRADRSPRRASRRPFEIDDYTRWRLMEGLDDIGLTLRHVDAIDQFEQTRPLFKPATLPAKVASVG